jgi:DNA (cytosine-5)-methyltransferase 1
MSSIESKFAVVDLFAGPGGLAEGFSSVTSRDGSRAFHIALSIEKESSAFSTLLLRAFLRQFEGVFPPEYYEFLRGGCSEPDWEVLYPAKWEAANDHCLKMELGLKETETVLNRRIDNIRKVFGSRTLLIGGPPCQAYSLVGRSRNRGVKGYRAEDDPKHFLYEQYINILNRLRPAAFVMENVKGVLSSSVNKGRIFETILADLATSGGPGGYELFALAPQTSRQTELLPQDIKPADFVVRSEEFGLPQARHRVIVVGFRRGLVSQAADPSRSILMKTADYKSTVRDVLKGMPHLRSGLSGVDGPEEWRIEMSRALRLVQKSLDTVQKGKRQLFRHRLAECEERLNGGSRIPPRAAKTPARVGSGCNSTVAEWLLDPSLGVLPNNETRGHMAADLARYLYAAIYAEVLGVSPKADDFPQSLAPVHENWNSGKFADRFRVQRYDQPSTTITSHISKDGHYFIHPDPTQCRSLTVREAARLQTFPDNYFFKGNRTEQFVQVGNAVPPFLAKQIGEAVYRLLDGL